MRREIYENIIGTLLGIAMLAVVFAFVIVFYLRWKKPVRPKFHSRSESSIGKVGYIELKMI